MSRDQIPGWPTSRILPYRATRPVVDYKPRTSFRAFLYVLKLCLVLFYIFACFCLSGTYSARRSVVLTCIRALMCTMFTCLVFTLGQFARFGCIELQRTHRHVLCVSCVFQVYVRTFHCCYVIMFVHVGPLAGDITLILQGRLLTPRPHVSMWGCLELSGGKYTGDMTHWHSRELGWYM